MNQDIVIKPWMLKDLHLQGAALLVFALWFADRQERSVRELATMLGASERGIRKVLTRVNEAKEQSSARMEQSSEIREQSSAKKEQSSQIQKEIFPQTPIKENIPPPPEKNAPTRPHEVLISWITDDASMRPYAEEFLNGLKARGEDPEQKGAAELRRHFGFWLPKFQAKREIAAKRQQCAAGQNEAKDARDADSEKLQRKYDADLQAANTPEALAEGARVLAKFGKNRKL